MLIEEPKTDDGGEQAKFARALHPPELKPPSFAYSHGVRAGSLVFVGGQISVDAEGRLVGGGDISAQTRQTLANVASVLRAGGATLSDVVSTTVYLTDLECFREYDSAYSECFGSNRPARATVRADLVRAGALIEIQAIAFVPDD